MLVLLGVLVVATSAHAADGDVGLQVLGPDSIASSWTPVETVTPVYPMRLAQRGVSGCVTLSYVIEADGRVSQVQMLDGRASPRSPIAEQLAIEQFADAASAAVSAMRFSPKGEARSTLTATTLHFGEPATSAGCEGTLMARRLEQKRDWEGLLGSLATRRSFAYTPSENGGNVVRAMDSPWDGTTQIILSAPQVATSGH